MSNATVTTYVTYTNRPTVSGTQWTLSLGVAVIAPPSTNASKSDSLGWSLIVDWSGLAPPIPAPTASGSGSDRAYVERTVPCRKSLPVRMRRELQIDNSEESLAYSSGVMPPDDEPDIVGLNQTFPISGSLAYFQRHGRSLAGNVSFSYRYIGVFQSEPMLLLAGKGSQATASAWTKTDNNFGLDSNSIWVSQ